MAASPKRSGVGPQAKSKIKLECVIASRQMDGSRFIEETNTEEKNPAGCIAHPDEKPAPAWIAWARNRGPAAAARAVHVHSENEGEPHCL